jgi:hypothetical protein
LIFILPIRTVPEFGRVPIYRKGNIIFRINRSVRKGDEPAGIFLPGLHSE